MTTKSVSEELTKYREVLSEAWDTTMHTAKKDKGMFKGKSKEEIGSSLSKNKKTAENDRAAGRKEPESLKKKIKQQEFALRAKNNFGKVSESVDLREGVRVGFEQLLKDHDMDVDAFLGGDDLPSQLYDALYEYYFDEMPYGIAKARTGDPYVWVSNRFARDLQHEGLIGKDELANYTISIGTEVSEREGSFNENLPTLADTLDQELVFNNSRTIGEGKTMRKCKGKGCDKKCYDGKEFCSAACKKSAGVKESYGPFSKKGYVISEGGKNGDEEEKCSNCGERFPSGSKSYDFVTKKCKGKCNKKLLKKKGK